MKKVFVLVPLAVLLSSPQALAGGISFDEGKALALEKMPGKIIETERDHGVYEYEIKQEDGSIGEVEIDAATGTILEVKIERFGSNYDVPEPKISADQAKDAAAAHLGKAAKIVESAYVLVNGAWVYEIEADLDGAEYEVLVDAMSGEVLSAVLDD